MTKEEEIALGEYLCEWPDDKTYQEIFEDLKYKSEWPDGYQPLEAFEDYPAHDIMIMDIDALKNTLEKNYGINAKS